MCPGGKGVGWSDTSWGSSGQDGWGQDQEQKEGGVRVVCVGVKGQTSRGQWGPVRADTGLLRG